MSEGSQRRELAARLARYAELVPDMAALVEAMARPLAPCILTHTGRTTPAAFERLLAEDGADPRRVGWEPAAFRLGRAEGLGGRFWYLAGLGHAMEEASLLPARALGARPGERVLDLCAAPGGKTAQLALAVGAVGTVVANDVAPPRLRALRANLDRLGLVNVSLTRHDGGNYPGGAGRFDRVLVDAPCSSEGVVRRAGGRARDEAPWDDEQRAALARRQRELVRRAVRLCRPGGRVVYSTCTFAPEENEAVVDAVLGELGPRGLSVVPIEVPGLEPAGGVVEWRGARFAPELARAARLWPERHGTGGFFVAALELDPQAAAGRAGEEPEPAPWEPRAAALDEWRPHVVERYGIPDAAVAGWLVHRQGKHHLHVTNTGHRAPAAPAPEVVGLRLVKTRLAHPKPSTAAALLLAPRATRNVIDLEPPEVVAVLRRASFPLDPARAARCTGTGWVLLRHRGAGLGTGFFSAEAGTVRSLFPRDWNGGYPDAAFGPGIDPFSRSPSSPGRED